MFYVDKMPYDNLFVPDADVVIPALAGCSDDRLVEIFVDLGDADVDLQLIRRAVVDELVKRGYQVGVNDVSRK